MWGVFWTYKDTTFYSNLIEDNSQVGDLIWFAFIIKNALPHLCLNMYNHFLYVV